jgi:hypothetical protein
MLTFRKMQKRNWFEKNAPKKSRKCCRGKGWPHPTMQRQPKNGCSPQLTEACATQRIVTLSA